MTQSVILIDPNARTVTVVESSGTIEHLQELTGASYLETMRVNSDLLLFADRPAETDLPFAMNNGAVVRGRAIIAHGSDELMTTPELTADLVRANVTFVPVESVAVLKLKISKKMAELLAAEFPESGDTRRKIAAEIEAGRADKAGAVLIDATPPDTALLHGYALGSISRLDAALKTADESIKHRLMGEHSAWRSLLRQFPPTPSTTPE